MGVLVNTATPVAVALRLLQKYDEVAFHDGGYDQAGERRRYIIEAESYLGMALGLECTGREETPGVIDHDGDTCAIHEWLVPADQEDLGVAMAVTVTEVGAVETSEHRGWRGEAVRLSERHELRAHAGEACRPSRLGMLAYLAHSLGFPADDPAWTDDLVTHVGGYERQHRRGGSANGASGEAT